MIRYRIAARLGLVEPLIRMQRGADAAARASVRREQRAPAVTLRRADA